MNAIKQFQSYMESIGAVKIPNYFSDFGWQIETKYGLLEISLHRDDFTKTGKPKSRNSNLISIFRRFKDFEKAKEFIKEFKGEMFPTNSKINLHLSGGLNSVETWNTAFEIFKRDLKEIV